MAAGLLAVLVMAGVSAAVLNTVYERATDRTAEMVDAATRAVPPGNRVESRFSGRAGVNLGVGFDYRGAFEVRLAGESESGPIGERFELFDTHMRSLGWQREEIEERPNATVGYYRRDGLVADVHVRGSPTWWLNVEEGRSYWERNGPELVGAVAGGSLTAVFLLALRRRLRSSVAPET